MRPLPLFSHEARPALQTEYEEAIRERIDPGSPMLDIHLDVASMNLGKRFGHIDKTPRDPKTQLEYMKLSRTMHDTPERVRAYFATASLRSLEVSTYIEAGNPSRTVRTDLGDNAINALVDAEGVEVIEDKRRLRAKVTRIIGQEAAIITTKLDGLSVRQGDKVVSMKARESGFVMLDDENLSRGERTVFRALGGAMWTPELEEHAREAVDHMKDKVSSALATKAIFHPTVSVLYLASDR